MAMAFLFGVLTLTLLANQVATGLALTIFGVGLSALIGAGFVGTPFEPGCRSWTSPASADLPVLGPLLFGHDLLVYLSVRAGGRRSPGSSSARAPGLILRAVGENHDAAHSIGYPVIGVRYLAVLFGGAMAGLGGAYLSLAYTPMWAENMTAGRGWIALALVVFASWRPGRVLLGAYIFGGVTILQLHAQGAAASHPVAVPVDAALSRHHPGAGPDLHGRARRSAERAGLPRQGVPSGRLTGPAKTGKRAFKQNNWKTKELK